MEIDAIVLFCQQKGFPEPVREFRFAPPRRWRLDYAFPEQKIALEQEGGCWVNGRHNRASGFLRDMIKYNTLALMGYRLIRFTPQMLSKGDLFPILEELFRECRPGS